MLVDQLPVGVIEEEDRSNVLVRSVGVPAELSRITQLTVDDVIRDGNQVLLRLVNPPSPDPEPVAAPLLAYLGQRTNMATATNRESRWLFPGRRAGQPIHPRSMSTLINALGIPATTGRAAASAARVARA